MVFLSIISTIALADTMSFDMFVAEKWKKSVIGFLYLHQNAPQMLPVSQIVTTPWALASFAKLIHLYPMEIPTTTLTIVAYTTCSVINVVFLLIRLTGDLGLNGAIVL